MINGKFNVKGKPELRQAILDRLSTFGYIMVSVGYKPDQIYIYGASKGITGTSAENYYTEHDHPELTLSDLYDITPAIEFKSEPAVTISVKIDGEWYELEDWVKWIAKNKSGVWWQYNQKPCLLSRVWRNDGESRVISFPKEVEDPNWEDSLIEVKR